MFIYITKQILSYIMEHKGYKNITWEVNFSENGVHFLYEANQIYNSPLGVLVSRSFKFMIHLTLSDVLCSCVWTMGFFFVSNMQKILATCILCSRDLFKNYVWIYRPFGRKQYKMRTFNFTHKALLCLEEFLVKQHYLSSRNIIDKTMCEVLWRNISDFYVNLRVEVAAVSRNRYGVKKTVDTHKILINAIKFYVCLQEIW